MYEHEERDDAEAKNHLLAGTIEINVLVDLLIICRGDQYERSVHHADRAVTVHIFKPRGWYIKAYYQEPDTIFISVHPSEHSS